MTLNDYQKAARTTAVYPKGGCRERIQYAANGLFSEAGEVAGHLKRVYRDDRGVFTQDRVSQMVAEVGDVLWYIATLAHELGVSLETVAKQNIAKLAARAEAGTLHGQGDQR